MSGMARVMFVLGGPACGKGTACQAAELTGNFWHISAGELLRQNVPSEHKDLVEKCFTEGKIVPAHITVDLLHQRMKKLGWSSKPFLIDGFPRNMLNYNTWFSQMPLASVEKAVYFWCPEHLFLERLKKRQGKRSDDNETTIGKRMQSFKIDTIPVIQRFRSQGILNTIDVSGSVEDMNKEFFKVLNQKTLESSLSK